VSIGHTRTLPYFIALGQAMYEKTLQKSVYTFSIFAHQGGLLGRSSPITGMYTLQQRPD